MITSVNQISSKSPVKDWGQVNIHQRCATAWSQVKNMFKRLKVTAKWRREINILLNPKKH